MESTPLLNDARTEEKSKLGNLLKANLIFLIFHLAINIRNPVLNQYIYQRYVRDLQPNLTESASSNLSSKCFVNKSDPEYIIHIKAEEMSNNIQIIFGYVANPLCVFSSMFLGAYSDFIGRRILFVIPLLGEASRNALCTAIMYWDWDLKYMYIGEAITGLTSGYNGLIMASYVYSADNTPPKRSRTLGIAAVDFTTYFAAALSQAGTGYFINYAGFMYPSLVTAGLMFLAMVLVIVMLPETVPVKKQEPCLTPIQAVKNVFGFYFSKDFGKKRSLFWIAFLAFFVAYVVSAGTGTIDYMLVLNQPFCWGPEKIGFFNMAYMFCMQFLGMGIIKLLHACTTDEVIAFLTLLIRAGGDVLHGLAYTDFMLYATIITGGIGAASIPVIRAIMSRMAPAGIQGAMFAGLSSVSIISSSIGQTVFGVVYDETVEIDRGIVYYVSGGSRVLAAGILVIFICLAPGILRQIKTETVVINDNDWKPGPSASKPDDKTDSQV